MIPSYHDTVGQDITNREHGTTYDIHRYSELISQPCTWSSGEIAVFDEHHLEFVRVASQADGSEREEDKN